MGLGGSASVHKLRVPARKILNQLTSSSERMNWSRPEWIMFARDGITGRWGLTPNGADLAASDEVVPDRVFAQSPVAKPVKPRVITCQTYGCGNTFTARFVGQKAGSCDDCCAQRRLLRDLHRPVACVRYTSVPDAEGVEVGDPRQPTQARPGSPTKLAILAARAELQKVGLWSGPIHLPGDNGYRPDASDSDE